jgi:hypothetical protein
MQADLYDLSEKIVAARGLEVPTTKIAAAKRNKKTLIAKLAPAVPVEITYDTIVIEGGKLNIYPDVYEHNSNTVENVRRELQMSGVAHDQLSDAEIKKMISRATGRQKFVVEISAVEADLSLTKGRAVSVVPTAK